VVGVVDAWSVSGLPARTPTTLTTRCCAAVPWPCPPNATRSPAAAPGRL